MTINVSCEYLLTKEWRVTYTHHINLIEAIIRRQKLHQRITYSNPFAPKKIRELLTSGAIFTVNRYAYFMENNSICSCKHSKIWYFASIYFLVLMKKHRSTRWTSRFIYYQMVKRKINCRKNYSINTRLILKARFVWQRKSNAITKSRWKPRRFKPGNCIIEI